MQMSNEEIVRDYREAKDKKAQVGILADLNLCSKEQIVEVLREGGVAPRQLPRMRKRGAAPAGGEAPCARQTSGKHDGIIVAALTAYRTQIEAGMEADRLAYEAKATEGARVLREIDTLLEELRGGAKL